MAVALILTAEPLPAQQPAPLPAALKIVVVDGEGTIHDVRDRAVHNTIVRVEDEGQRPIAGAAVVFTLPTEGVTGEFGNGSKNLTVVTDNQGTAKAQGLKVYHANGKLPIHVNASYRGLTARTTIMQFVEGAPPGAKVTAHHGGSGKVIAIAVVIGAAAAGGGAYAALKKGGSSTSGTPTAATTAIGITPGTITISPPH